jgi:hypothetical protein
MKKSAAADNEVDMIFEGNHPSSQCLCGSKSLYRALSNRVALSTVASL